MIRPTNIMHDLHQAEYEKATLQLFARLNWYYKDQAYQGLMNNLYSNNPGELDRWADDGGKVPWNS